jgi:hypothetical protein
MSVGHQSSTACQDYEASFVSQISAHFWDAVERERRESQGCTGTAAPCESESHRRRLHAGSRSTEARGAEQSGKTGAEGRGFGDQTRLTGSNWIMKKNGGIAEVLFCWRPRRDLNPCYRRERTRADGKLLKLRDTDGYLKRFQ